MSLINEALKKAQRIRSVDPTDAAVASGDTPRVQKRRQPRSAQQLILLAAGGLALVVLTMVATVYLFNRPPETRPAPPAVKPIVPKSGTESGAPSIVVPPLSQVAISPPAPVPAETSTPAPTTASGPLNEKPAVAAIPNNEQPPPPPPAPSTAIAAAPPTAATQSPAASAQSPTSTSPASAPKPAVPDAQIQAFVEALRVAGVRSSGGDSRVLMNDRVYRLNDIVDRASGLRLTKVEADSLTFADSKGCIYVKNL